MHRVRTILVAIGATIVLPGRAPTALAYCAMCQTTLLNSPEGQELAAGFQSGLLSLLAAPFVVSAVVALLLLRRYVPFHSKHPTRTPSPARGAVEQDPQVLGRREPGWQPRIVTPATQQSCGCCVRESSPYFFGTERRNSEDRRYLRIVYDNFSTISPSRTRHDPDRGRSPAGGKILSDGPGACWGLCLPRDGKCRGDPRGSGGRTRQSHPFGHLPQGS